MSEKMHEHEVAIDISLAQDLVRSQFPQWAKLPIQFIKSSGTDNAIFHLGATMCIRLPRIASAERNVALEQKWLPYLASHLPLAIPIAVAQGIPQTNYPFHWSIYHWLEGENAAIASITNQHQVAIDLAQFICALQKIDSDGGPLSRRGVPLQTRDYEVHAAIKNLHGIIDIQSVTMLWNRCLQAPAWNKKPVWIHGDLLPANLLVQKGRITGVIDFDSFGIGDPACDLIPAWSLFSHDSRTVFRSTLAVDDATWMRGCGWALSISLIIIPYYKNTNSNLVTVALRTIHELLTGF